MFVLCSYLRCTTFLFHALMQRTQHIAALRRIVARLESAFPDVAPVPLPFGLPEIDRHLPGAGLTGGALHEVMAASYGDSPAAFGFAIALMVHALAAHRNGEAEGRRTVAIGCRHHFMERA